MREKSQTNYNNRNLTLFFVWKIISRWFVSGYAISLTAKVLFFSVESTVYWYIIDTILISLPLATPLSRWSLNKFPSTFWFNLSICYWRTLIIIHVVRHSNNRFSPFGDAEFVWKQNIGNNHISWNSHISRWHKNLLSQISRGKCFVSELVKLRN